jgi:hypothetical protein
MPCPSGGWEEIPIAETVSDDGICDVVGRDREAFDLEAHGVLSQVGEFALRDMSFRQIGLVDMDFSHRISPFFQGATLARVSAPGEAHTRMGIST